MAQPASDPNKTISMLRTAPYHFGPDFEAASAREIPRITAPAKRAIRAAPPKMDAKITLLECSTVGSSNRAVLPFSALPHAATPKIIEIAKPGAIQDRQLLGTVAIANSAQAEDIADLRKETWAIYHGNRARLSRKFASCAAPIVQPIWPRRPVAPVVSVIKSAGQKPCPEELPTPSKVSVIADGGG
ncbi:hypothetical protein ACFB49_22870 [Sphingomonas sp. DBB INV C78]